MYHNMSYSATPCLCSSAHSQAPKANQNLNEKAEHRLIGRHVALKTVITFRHSNAAHNFTVRTNIFIVTLIMTGTCGEGAFNKLPLGCRTVAESQMVDGEQVVRRLNFSRKDFSCDKAATKV